MFGNDADDDGGIELSRRTVLGGIAGVGLSAGAVSTGTYALMSDEEESANNTIQAGTLDLQVNGQDGVSKTLDVGPVGSGASGQVTATLTNDGSVDGKLDVGIGSVQSGEGVNNEAETGDKSAPGELDDYVFVEVGVVQNGVEMPAVGPAPLSVLEEFSRGTEALLGASQDATLYVDWTAPDLGNDAQGDTVTFDVTLDIVERPTYDPDAVVTSGDSIQAAIDAASAGDLIEVTNGTYAENVVVDKPLDVVSRNGPAYTSITGDGFASVQITSSDVSFEGFTVENGSANALAVDGKNGGSVSDISVSCSRFVQTSSATDSLVATIYGGETTNLSFGRTSFMSTGLRLLYFNSTNTNPGVTDSYFAGAPNDNFGAVGVRDDGGEVTGNVFVVDLTETSGASFPVTQLGLGGSGANVEDNLFETTEDHTAAIADTGDNYSDVALVDANRFFGGGQKVVNN